MDIQASNETETPPTPTTPAGEDSVDQIVGHFRDRLQWQPHPDRPGHLRGFLRDKPTLTLFLIEICEDNPERGRLLGAVIPDDHERDGSFERSLIWWLRESVAPQYLAEFVAYLSKSVMAENSALRALVKSAHEWGANGTKGYDAGAAITSHAGARMILSNAGGDLSAPGANSISK